MFGWEFAFQDVFADYFACFGGGLTLSKDDGRVLLRVCAGISCRIPALR